MEMLRFIAKREKKPTFICKFNKRDRLHKYLFLPSLSNSKAKIKRTIT